MGRGEWQVVAAVMLALLAVRVLVMGREVAKRALPWTRLLVPAIVLIEGVGLWGGSGTVLWLARAATAIALEATLVIVAMRELRRRTPIAQAEPVEARIARALTALLPAAVARVAAVELVILGSAFAFLAGGWRRAAPAGFTYHRESALRMLLMAMPLLVIGDILLLELVLLPHAALWLRVVLHAAAIYGALWLVGLYATVRARPHVIADGVLVLHRGVLRRLAIPVADIAAIKPRPVFGNDWTQRAYGNGVARLDVAGATVLELELRLAARPFGVFGEGAPSTRVYVAIDDPAAFRAALGAAI